jgi:DNA gyrase subunit A
LPVDADRSIAGLLPVSQQQLEGDQDYVVLVTKQGLVKRTPLSAYRDMTSRGKIAIRLNEGDAVGWAALCTLGDSLVVATAKGMLLKYDVDAVRETARATMGVKALKLRDDDELATARVVAPDKDHVLVLTAAGYGKRVDVRVSAQNNFERSDASLVDLQVEAVRARSRATMGVQAIKFKKEGDVLVDVRGVADDDEVLVVTSGGTIARVAANTIAAQSRTAKGVSVQKSTAKDPCVGISLVPGDLAGVVADE